MNLEQHQCNVCGFEWGTTPETESGNSCPFCGDWRWPPEELEEQGKWLTSRGFKNPPGNPYQWVLFLISWNLVIEIHQNEHVVTCSAYLPPVWEEGKGRGKITISGYSAKEAVDLLVGCLQGLISQIHPSSAE